MDIDNYQKDVYFLDINFFGGELVSTGIIEA